MKRMTKSYRVIIVLLILTCIFANTIYATVPVNEGTRQYFSCNGSKTTYTFTLKGNSSDDFLVYKRLISTGVETLLRKSADYSIAATGGSYLNGGVVTIKPALANTYQVVIVRAIKQSQEVPSSAKTSVIINALDKLTREVRDLQDKSDRSIRLPNSDLSLDMNLPNSVERANKYLVFDSSGNPTVSSGNPTVSSGTTDRATQKVTYIVYKSGSNYYAQASPETGLSDYSNTNFVDLMDTVFNVVGRNGTNWKEGNKIVLREGIYYLTKTWTIKPTQDFELDCGTSAFVQTGTAGDMIVVDSFMNCIFKFGMIVPGNGAGTSGYALKICPTTPGPDSLTIGIVSQFHIVGILNPYGNPNTETAVCFDATNGRIGLNQFNFQEIADADLGILILAPGASYFDSNRIQFSMHLVNNGIQLGTTHTQMMGANIFVGNIVGSPSGYAINTYAESNVFTLTSISFAKDVILNSGAASNVFYGFYSGGFIDNSGNTTNKFFTN